MNDMTFCRNHEALVTYVYDECRPAERDSIAAHVATCASCAEEIQALRETREQLGAWTPPALPLGFQITRMEGGGPSNVLRPGAWWRQPLPAWAQVAAAAVIFAAGLTMGGLRAMGEAPSQSSQARPAPGTTRPAAATASLSRDEVARLDARLRKVEAAQTERMTVQLARTPVDEEAIFDRVQTLVDERIAQSEVRQRGETVRVLGGFARELDAHRQATQRVGLMEEELLEQGQAIRTIGSSLVRAAVFQPVAAGR